MVMNDFDELTQYNELVESLKELVIQLESLETSDHVGSEMVLQNIQSYIIGQMDILMDSMKDIQHRIQNNAGKVA